MIYVEEEEVAAVAMEEHVRILHHFHLNVLH
jgi:hypothetical protein